MKKSATLNTEQVFNLLQNGIQGKVLIADDRENYAYDFGGMMHSPPLAVVKATCQADVVHTLKIANDLGIPVALRGAGHSCNGQSLCKNGIIIVNFSDQPQFQMLDSERVAVSARTSWLHLETGLNKIGRSIPVLPDYLNLSVGGTLSVGGYGRRSLIYGAQIDHVEKLKLINFDGTTIWCSPYENSELFRHVLAGLGRWGIIEKVVMQTIPYRPFITQHIFKHTSTTKLIDSIEWLDEWQGETPCQFHASFGGNESLSIYNLEGHNKNQAMFQSLPQPLRSRPSNQVSLFKDYSLKYHHYINQLYSSPGYYHTWVDYFLDFNSLRQFLGVIEATLRASQLSRYVNRANILAIRASPHEYKLPYRAGATTDKTVFLVGLYPRIPASESLALQQIQASMHSLTMTCLELGGRPYLHGWYKLDNKMKRELFGKDYMHLKSLHASVQSL